MPDLDHTTIPVGHKRCIRCKEIKLLELYPPDRNTCNACRNEQRRQRRVLDPEKYRVVERAYRTKNHDHVLQVGRDYAARNRDRINETMRNWRAENNAHANELMRASYRRHADERRAYTKEKKRLNPLPAKVYEQRRRARKRDLPHTFTHMQWQCALDYFHGCCAVCGRPPGLWHTLAQDHWIPLTSSVCPGTTALNIVPLCHGDNGCNNRKNKYEAVKFLEMEFGKRKAAVILKRIRDYFEWVSAQA